jgi:hypothetical protein
LLKLIKIFYMKNILISLLILIGMYSNVSAQNCGDNCKKKEQIKAQKVAFITDKLQLTVEEAQQFWPIYNEMNKKSDDIENQIRTIVKNYKTNKETLSSSELETMADKMVELQVNSAKLDAEYYQKFKKVLPIRKIMELNQAEREFKHELLQKLKGCSPAKE